MPVTLVHERKFAPQEDTNVFAEHEGGKLLLLDEARRNVLLAVNGAGAAATWTGTHESEQMKRLDITFPVDLPAGGSREFFVTLPSPVVNRVDKAALLALDYREARTRTLEFWKNYLAQRTSPLPEQAVNALPCESLARVAIAAAAR